MKQLDENLQEVFSEIRVRRAEKLPLLMAVLVLCLMPTVCTSQPWEEYEFVLEWGSFGSDTGQFNWPRGMCADKKGYVYVCDGYNHRIQKFDSLGNFVMMFFTVDTVFPDDITVDDSGYAYVTSVVTNQVQKFDSYGGFVLAWGDSGSAAGQFLDCFGICGDSSYLYVTDRQNHRVQKFDHSGNFCAQWSSPDSSHWNPVSIAIHQSSVFAYNWYPPQNIQKFDTSGNFILEWSNMGWAPEENAFIRDMASDDSGSVYVAEGWNDRCQKFDSNGKLLAVWGSGGTGPGLFDYPFGIAVGSDSCVYVSDVGSHKILKFRKTD